MTEIEEPQSLSIGEEGRPQSHQKSRPPIRRAAIDINPTRAGYEMNRKPPQRLVDAPPLRGIVREDIRLPTLERGLVSRSEFFPLLLRNRRFPLISNIGSDAYNEDYPGRDPRHGGNNKASQYRK
ncbi:hypothetical protein GCM10018779_05110 [Streptomyces griseocarneus]|nr:hypothetical protein GCM10018779_05110 [Streptomyces griseocarneus]